MKSSRQDVTSKSLLFKMAALCSTFFTFLSIPLPCTKIFLITFRLMPRATLPTRAVIPAHSTFWCAAIFSLQHKQQTNKQAPHPNGITGHSWNVICQILLSAVPKADPLCFHVFGSTCNKQGGIWLKRLLGTSPAHRICCSGRVINSR